MSVTQGCRGYGMGMGIRFSLWGSPYGYSHLGITIWIPYGFQYGSPDGSYGDLECIADILILESNHIDKRMKINMGIHRGFPYGSPWGSPQKSCQGMGWVWEWKFHSHGNPVSHTLVTPSPWKRYVTFGWTSYISTNTFQYKARLDKVIF